jgi:hypothetical protein
MLNVLQLIRVATFSPVPVCIYYLEYIKYTFLTEL